MSDCHQTVVDDHLKARFGTVRLPEYLVRDKFKGVDNTIAKCSSKGTVGGIYPLRRFPIIALTDYEEQSAYQIVNGIYHTVVSRDIVKRHRISKQDLFDRVVRYIIENMGKTFSANSITKFLKSERRTETNIPPGWRGLSAPSRRNICL